VPSRYWRRCPAAKLVVNAPALVAVGANHVKTAQGSYSFIIIPASPAQTDVGALAGHIG